MRAWMFLAPLALTACASNYAPTPLTEKQAAKMDKALTGLVPGEKVNCVNREPQTNFTVISGNTLLYRVSKKLVYKNELIGSCTGLARGDTMIVRTWGSQYCRGDITTSADLMTGINTGSCALGDFTPYRPAQ